MKAAYLFAFVAALVGVANATDLTTYAKIAKEVNSNPASTWTAGINAQMLDLDYTALKNMMGDLSVGSEHSPLPEKKLGWSVDVKDLPKNFLVQEKWPECQEVLETVHDQSACGSCWAISTAAAASGRYCIANKGENLFLSGRDITSCCSDCGYGCNGGWPSAAWSYIKSQGIPSGSPDSENKSLCSRYPFLSCFHHVDGTPQCSDYDFDTPKCVRACDSDSTYTIPYQQDKRRSQAAYSVYGEANMMKDLYENGPMTVSYTVFEDFMTYREGVYKHTTGRSLGGHAVVLMGWGENSAGVKYWIVKNNWNESWGVSTNGENIPGNKGKGYFLIIRGTNDCGIESGANAGTF